MAFPKDLLATLKERADIVEVVGERVHLQSAGQDYVGLCPFHGEKTPSFRVSPAWRTYHCFGCGAGGSAIDFVMAAEGLSFPEAVRNLADRFGVALPDDGGPREAGDRSREVLQAAEAHYAKLLAGAPAAERARRYLTERSFAEPDWEAFKLGWALDEWQGFMHHALGEGFTHEDLLASGLVRQRETGRMFDMLRKRVLFPIRDERGRPIAFGGRVIDPEDNPKYLNTPETRHYQKSRVLFGLAEGLPTLRKSKRALLVEGYLDVLRLHQRGFPEAVATCGTALTDEHLKLLGRFAERTLLVFDGDKAGIQAALRSAPLFLNAAQEARVVLLPDGQDPDDFLARNPPEAFAALLEDATPLLEFLVFQLAKQNGRSVQGRQQTLDALAPVLGQIRTAAARDLTVRYVADLVGVEPRTVLGMIKPAQAAPTGSGGGTRGRAAPEGAAAGTAEGAAASTAEGAAAPGSFGLREGRHQRRALRLLLERRELLGHARERLRPEELTDAVLRRLYERVLAYSDDEFAATGPQALADAQPELGGAVRSLLMEEPLHGHAVADAQRQFDNELLCIKEALKDDLFRTFKSLVGSAEEELALRRYRKLRDELAELKAGFRSTHKPRPEVTLRAPERATTDAAPTRDA